MITRLLLFSTLILAGCDVDGTGIVERTLRRRGELPGAVWPHDATGFVAESHGGGLSPEVPDGANCSWGLASFAYDAKTRQLSWEVCTAEGAPLHLATGARFLSAAERAQLDRAMRHMEVSTIEPCTFDKHLLTITVTTPRGEETYTDVEVSCAGDGPFVDHIEDLFETLRDLTGT
jgi:hypothetical protein